MAMLTREALIAAKGYRCSPIVTGWEDYDLWCRLATLGVRGVFVPELLCDYRIHNSSMLRTRTNEQLGALHSELALTYSELFLRSDRPKRRRPDLQIVNETAITREREVVREPEISCDVGLESHLDSIQPVLRPQTSLYDDPDWDRLAPLISEFFDKSWYEHKYPDLVGANGGNLLLHFILHGAAESRDPSPHFDTSFYVTNYPHVLESGHLPIAHYLLSGKPDGLNPKIYHIMESDAALLDHNLPQRDLVRSRVCCLAHIYHTELANELTSYIHNVGPDCDVFINLVDDTWTPEVHERLASTLPNARIIISPDHGRDIGGFFRLLRHVHFSQYDVFLFIHSKKSPHLTTGAGDIWRRGLLDDIIGSPETASKCIKFLRSDANVGIVAGARWRRTDVLGNSEKVPRAAGLGGDFTRSGGIANLLQEPCFSSGLKL